MVALDAMVDGIETTILVAETTHARGALIRDATLTFVIPVAILLGFVLLWTMFGLARALRPLNLLRTDVSRRSPEDLAPLPVNTVPLEVRPLVEEINALLARLAQAQDAQRRFIADAAHQLRTPLASLRAYADLAGREQHDPDALRHDLDRLHTAAERAARLVQQLLSLARTEPGAEAGMQWQDVALDEIVRERAPDWLHRADERQQTLDFEVASAHVHGDTFKLGELMENLVDNALRYTPEGGHITLRLRAEGEWHVLEIEDNGPGIPEGQRQQVFERFQRLPGSVEGGSGLGLAIVCAIARLHAARVEIDTPAGHPGALLRVTFPAFVASPLA